MFDKMRLLFSVTFRAVLAFDSIHNLKIIYTFKKFMQLRLNSLKSIVCLHSPNKVTDDSSAISNLPLELCPRRSNLTAEIEIIIIRNISIFIYKNI